MKFLQSVLLSVLASASSLLAEPFEIHIDADYSVTKAAAESIELGIRTALDEADYQLGSLDVVIVPKDHRGNVKRSFRNLTQYVESDVALAVVGGLHSPPYLTHKDFVNKNEVLVLLPWSAAGPITRTDPQGENWFFRLSVDDSRSGEFFVTQAVDKGGCSRLALVLLETGWGRANHATLSAALEKRGLQPSTAQYFSASVGSTTARTLAENVARSGADCGVLLGNGIDGGVIANALFERMPDLRLYSHWGILGGGFIERVPHEMREALELRVLQTCGFRRESEGSPTLVSALRSAGIDGASLRNVPAPTGFVHGYDLGRVLIAAAAQASAEPAWDGSILEKRRALHNALERLAAPVEGILKTYQPPFRPHNEDPAAGHEALSGNDLCMARFDASGLLKDDR